MLSYKNHNVLILNQKRLELFNAYKPGQVRRVFIVGASGAGKSTLWRALKEISHSQVHFPPRFISRFTRPDDNLDENQHIGHDEFAEKFKNDSMHFYWSKYLPEKTELYGFEKNNSKLSIYSCNNEFVLNFDSAKCSEDILLNSIVVMVSCSQEQRVKRLVNRQHSHFTPTSEISYRLDNGLANELVVRQASDIFFDNSVNKISIIDAARKIASILQFQIF